MYHFELHHTGNHSAFDTFCKTEHVDRTYLLAAVEEEKKAKRRNLFRRVAEMLKKEHAAEDEDYSYQSARIPTL